MRLKLLYLGKIFLRGEYLSYKVGSLGLDALIKITLESIHSVFVEPLP